MIERTLAAGVLLALAAGSAWLYDHRGRAYATGREASDASPAAFRHVYAWVRVTTPVAGLGAMLTSQPAWLPMHRSRLALAVGMALAVAGFALFARARRQLGRQYSPCFDAFRPTALVARGVYARVRHPIYGANLCLLAGLALATGSGWIVLNLALVAAYYLRSARREEDELARLFPEYSDYMIRTGRFFPRLRARW